MSRAVMYRIVYRVVALVSRFVSYRKKMYRCSPGSLHGQHDCLLCISHVAPCWKAPIRGTSEQCFSISSVGYLSSFLSFSQDQGRVLLCEMLPVVSKCFLFYFLFYFIFSGHKGSISMVVRLKWPSLSDRNLWMSTSCAPSATQSRSRSDSFHACTHHAGEYHVTWWAINWILRPFIRSKQLLHCVMAFYIQSPANVDSRRPITNVCTPPKWKAWGFSVRGASERWTVWQQICGENFTRGNSHKINLTFLSCPHQNPFVRHSNRITNGKLQNTEITYCLKLAVRCAQRTTIFCLQILYISSSYEQQRMLFLQKHSERTGRHHYRNHCKKAVKKL